MIIQITIVKNERDKLPQTQIQIIMRTNADYPKDKEKSKIKKRDFFNGTRIKKKKEI
jgi:hypothetical protein